MSIKKDEKLLEKFMKNGGCLPSPEDKRDYTVETVSLAVAPLPEEYIVYGMKILNQGAVGSCVAHACATSMGYGELQTGVRSAHDFSRGYIYGNRSITDYQGEGMCTRQALKQLHHCGDCELKDFPYNEIYPSVKARIEKNKKKLAEKASNFKILNYFRCYSDDETKRTIIANGSAIIAVPIYSSFGSDCPMPSDTDMYKGSHAMCIVGWDKTGWIIQNSWGKNWGKKGLLHLPYEYPITEIWGITVSPTMPKPTKTSLWHKITHWFKWLILQIKILFNKK